MVINMYVYICVCMCMCVCVCVCVCVWGGGVSKMLHHAFKSPNFKLNTNGLNIFDLYQLCDTAYIQYIWLCVTVAFCYH
jgi:hypothetical protein